MTTKILQSTKKIPEVSKKSATGLEYFKNQMVKIPQLAWKFTSQPRKFYIPFQIVQNPALKILQLTWKIERVSSKRLAYKISDLARKILEIFSAFCIGKLLLDQENPGIHLYKLSS